MAFSFKYFPFLFFVLALIPYFNINAQNLLNNPGMEDNDVSPAGWEHDSYLKGITDFIIEKDGAHSGNNYVSIINNQDNDSKLFQAVDVMEYTKYRISAWIKTENINPAGIGAYLCICDLAWHSSRDIRGTKKDWELVEFYIDVLEGVDTINLCLRLGGNGDMNSGKASFDDIEISETDYIPPEIRNYKIGKSENTAEIKLEPEEYKNEDETFGTILVIILLVLSLAAFILLLKLTGTVKTKKTGEKPFDD